MNGPGRAPVVPACHGDVCITCSDTAVEVRILRLLPDGLAVVDTGQGEEEVSVALVSAGPGDTVLVHAREAIAVVSGPQPPGAAAGGPASAGNGQPGGGGDARR
jgi:hydrogenase maturation factor